jgi:tetratricopeptide (TPR) repeat protein
MNIATDKIFTNWQEENELAYENLLVSIEASQRNLNILICVCDNNQFREEIIHRYTEEIGVNIPCYQITLDKKEPSLRAAIADLVGREPKLQQATGAVITATGVERLGYIQGSEERTELDIFFGYLQWTREGLREFPYSIVLWITSTVEGMLRKKAPDFWSWRKGIFRFVAPSGIFIPREELFPILQSFTEINTDNDSPLISLEDLLELIQQIEATKGEKEPRLASLYASLGGLYRNRLARGQFEDYRKEWELAIEYYQKAINLQRDFHLKFELATSMNSLANLYYSQGRYELAEPLYAEALALSKDLLGARHPHVAASMNNLAILYSSQGRYELAEPLYAEALALNKGLLGDRHPNVAASMNNLANLYYSQGRYELAEPLYAETLALRKDLLGDRHPHVATSMNNLANLYYSQGRYELAEPLYAEALALRKDLLGDRHPDVAASMNNLANLYSSQGRYELAEPLYAEALAIAEERSLD